jgi:hypothetical protein
MVGVLRACVNERGWWWWVVCGDEGKEREKNTRARTHIQRGRVLEFDGQGLIILRG